MKITRNKDRGSANFGWLKANYSFSFSNYYNPNQMNFGALRVFNDDEIDGGTGFGMHPHDNMEIITIPLSGSLQHRDSISSEWVTLKTGEVQVMTAGTGIVHAEKNNSISEKLNLFQIWIIPNKRDLQPNYFQKAFDSNARKNRLQTLVAPVGSTTENTLNVNQDAYISRIDLDANLHFTYEKKVPENGVFVMIISGEVTINNQLLLSRDAAEISLKDAIKIEAFKNSELLFIEVPLINFMEE